MTATQTAEDDFMSDELTVVQFETSTFTDQTYVSELSDGPPFTVHGIALGDNDVTVGQSGIKKLWPAEELQTAAETLKGTSLVVDHENGANGVVGQVTKAGYKDGTGVVYEAELFDEDLAEKVQNGLLEVSIRGYHADVDSLEEDDETDAKVVEDIEFDNLSIVPTGASPSNTLEMGEHAELGVAALRQFTGTLNAAELQEIEPGMWVKSNGTKGITISQVQDGEIEVDIYEESDGKWRSTGETEMFDTGSLTEWDVDEEEDIGEAEEDEEENAELVATDDKVQWDDGAAQGVVVERKTDGCFNERIDGDQEICAGEDEAVVLIEIVKDGERTGTMVAHKEGTVSEADFELAAVERGQFVKWKGVDNEVNHGQIIAINQDGQQMMATIRKFTAGGDKLDETVEKPVQGLDMWDTSPERGDEPRSDESDMDEPEGFDAPDLEEGQMVQWRVNPAMKGKIVHIPSDEPIVMIEVMEKEDGEFISTNETVSAGPGDVEPVEQMEDAGVTTKDVPVDSAEPTHDSGDTRTLMDMFKDFFSQLDGDDASLSDFADYLESEEELANIERGEGEEPVIDSKKDLEDSREKDPKWLDSEIEELESFDDYPEAAKENAQMALDAREETGNPNDCGTQVGWTRANQLADGESLSAEVVSKMAQFNRHRQNSEMDDDEGRADCGWMMWKAWGGDEGVDWAIDKMEQIEEEMAIADVPDKHLFTSRADAVDEAEDLEGVSGAHEIDGMWVPGETHEEYLEKVADASSEEREDSENMGKHHHEASMELVDEFMGQEGNDEETFVSAFLEWADDDNVRQAVDEFVAKEDNSLESGMSDLIAWLETKVDTAESATHPDKDDEEMEDSDELQAMHEPEWDSAEDKEWNAPDLEDFTDESWEDLSGDEKEEIANHFLVSKTGEFPPERFSDLALPVVEPDGTLNLNALSNAKARAGQVEEVSEEDEEQLNEMINMLANENFEDATFGENGEEAEAHSIGGTSGRPTASKTVGGVQVLSGDDLQQSADKTGESDVDELTTYQFTTMTSNIEEKLSELDEPVAVEATEVEELRDKADRFEEMSENLEALRERTDILDEVDRSQVEELAESDDPVVKESTRYEELQSEAEQVAGVYAAQLAEEYSAFSAEELTDKFSIEELREKFESEIGDVEEELASSESAEPKSQDADEESLEDAADEGDSDEAELSDEVASKQDEIRNKILGGD